MFGKLEGSADLVCCQPLLLGLILLSTLLAGCAALAPAMDPPKVSLVSFRDVTAAGGAPTFEIKLKVLNPNEQPLDIAGISYSVFLLDKELIAGVANDIPRIAGYGEGEVTVNASLQLLELLRLLASLGQTSADSLTYRLTAKIDFRGLVPTQRIDDSGEFKLK